MKPAKGLRFLVATAALVLALVAVGCTTVENVTIRPPQYEGDSTTIFGEVENHTAGYARGVRVKGSLFDAGGTVVDSPYFWVCPLVIKPYDTVVTGTYYSGKATIANYELHVESTPMEPVPDAALSISDLQVIENEYGNLGIEGVITNTGTESYEHISVCAAFYDASGKVDGFLFAFAPDVDPGQTASFDLSHSPLVEQGEPSSNAVTYRLWLEPFRNTCTGCTYKGYVSTGKLPLR